MSAQAMGPGCQPGRRHTGPREAGRHKTRTVSWDTAGGGGGKKGAGGSERARRTTPTRVWATLPAASAAAAATVVVVTLLQLSSPSTTTAARPRGLHLPAHHENLYPHHFSPLQLILPKNIIITTNISPTTTTTTITGPQYFTPPSSCPVSHPRPSPTLTNTYTTSTISPTTINTTITITTNILTILTITTICDDELRYLSRIIQCRMCTES